jgi:hypothetical protein
VLALGPVRLQLAQALPVAVGLSSPALVVLVLESVLRVLLAAQVAAVLVVLVEVLVFSLHLHTHGFHTIPEVGVFPVVYKSCIPYF